MTRPRNKDIIAILTRGLEVKASDILIAGGERVAYKVNGRWRREAAWDPLTDSEAAGLILGMLAATGGGADLEAKLPKDLDFSFSLPGGERFRVNVYRIQGRMAAVLRPIPSTPPQLEDLGLPLPPIERALRRKQGLILVTGATGSGKSTTLAAMIEWLNAREEIHIVTIEDPMEFFFQPKRAIISQREVGTDTESFASALRSALRQAPNVIMVGEMRDLETMQAAITAAETGHLVMATLHTRSAPEAVTRIIDAFPEGYRELVRLQLSSALSLVISQALLPNREETGRVLAYEILVNTPAVSNLIRENKIGQIANIMFTGQKEGMVTMAQCVDELVRKGLITPKTAETVKGEPKEV